MPPCFLCSFFTRKGSKDVSKGGAPAAPAPQAESPRSQPSFEAERAQLAEDVYILTAEKAKQQVSGIAWASLHALCKSFAA